MQDKLQGLAAQHTDVLESLAPKARKRVEALREIQVTETLTVLHIMLLKARVSWW